LSLYEALDITPPVFVTVPPILAEGGNKKLGKRDGAKDILEYQAEGYLPEAMMNFLALLGWNPGTPQEIFTKEELIKIFDITKIQISGAQVNIEKLDWINREHMKKLSREQIQNEIFKCLPRELQKKELILVISERISKWSDIDKMIREGELDWVLNVQEISKEKLVYKNSTFEQVHINLNQTIEALNKIDEKDFTIDNIKNSIMGIAETLPSRGELLHPIRFALSGKDKSPDPFTIASVIGKDETISRIKKQF
jgi:glutamyl/glutaminyl-tRNA synthetase